MTKWIYVASLLLPSITLADTTSYQCLNGIKAPNHSYELLKIKVQDGKITSIHYNSEFGPSLSGAFFGCSAEATKGDAGVKWSQRGKITRATLVDTGDSPDSSPTIVVEDTGPTFYVTFEGATGYFCGAQNTVPKYVTLFKESNRCDIEPGDM